MQKGINTFSLKVYEYYSMYMKAMLLKFLYWAPTEYILR